MIRPKVSDLPGTDPSTVPPTDGGSAPSAAADLALHRQLLEMIARAHPLPDTLRAMCLGIEQRYPGARCTVLLADHDEGVLHHVAGPSMPVGATAALDRLAIAVGVGACGTAAARGEIAVVADTFTHPWTATFLDAVRQYDLRSIWSCPLLAADDEVLGTFALYRGVIHTPDVAERDAVTAAAALGALAVERHRTQRALQVAATEDALTGLPNRSAFMGLLSRQLDEGHRTAVLFLDVDQFKLVNDSLGHRAGDRLLIEMGTRLRVRVQWPHTVARFGGDEFTVLVADATDATVAMVADHVDHAFADAFPIPGGEFMLTASIGIASHTGVGAGDAESLVRDADTAMYAAKAQGVGRVVFDDRLRRRLLDRMDLENALQQGLTGDEFEVWYQKIMDLRSRKITSMEALVRWAHPKRGPVAPEEFIGLAEETGLIVPLGARVLDIAIADAARMSLSSDPLAVAVNVSAIQLSDPTFGAGVAAMLRTHGLAPGQLLLELTESVAVAHGSTPRRTLAGLADLGVRLVIDDFGTGYSSIPLLRDLPVVGLKIDRTFTMALDADSRMPGVIAAMTDMAHAMNLFVVAEGVDTAPALETVTRLGCDFAQGFHISPPLPIES